MNVMFMKIDDFFSPHLYLIPSSIAWGVFIVNQNNKYSKPPRFPKYLNSVLKFKQNKNIVPEEPLGRRRSESERIFQPALPARQAEKLRVFWRYYIL
jgi:hypothetical protein